MAEVGGVAGPIGRRFWLADDPSPRSPTARLDSLIDGSLDKHVKSSNGNGFSKQTRIVEFCAKADFAPSFCCAVTAAVTRQLSQPSIPAIALSKMHREFEWTP
jgi:hypothetical protein